MPRIGRIVVPELPHHIVQRGHDRNEVFVEQSDYQYYLETLKTFKAEYDVRLYAYCLMTNHVHLLLSPADSTGIGKLMKRLAGRQTRYRNKQEGRSGTLWEGRYKSSIVDEADYLTDCVRYIELNPVRAMMDDHPGRYPWSSYGERAGDVKGDVLDELPFYTTETHEGFMMTAVPEGEWEVIRQSVKSNHITGSEKFCTKIEAAMGRRLHRRGPGRPKIVSVDRKK